MDRKTYRLVALTEEQWAIAVGAMRAVATLASDKDGHRTQVAAVADQIMRQLERQIYVATITRKGRDGTEREVSKTNYANNIDTQ